MEQYYNTNHLQGESLVNAIETNRTQNQRVIDIFKVHKKPLSASQVWNYFGDVRVPLTSIRRAMTNLMLEGSLRKTDVMITGMYGKPEHLYSLSVNLK